MKHSRSPFARQAAAQAHADLTKREVALEFLADAWNQAEDEGIDAQALAHASLFAAIATLVRGHGEQVAAAIIEALPDRILSGEYNLDRSIQ